MAGISAIVLVGGLGTRLRPVTYDVPKQLIPIAGQCALYHVLDLVLPSVSRIAIACGYRADDIERYLATHPYPVPVSVVREEIPLGTGGGLKNAEKHATDPFLFLNSDVVTGVDVPAMIEDFLRRDAVGMFSLFRVQDTSPYGVAELDGSGRIVRFVEKPLPRDSPSNWINAGVSIWRREVLDTIPSGKKVSFEQEVVPRLLGRGVYGFKFTNWWEDAGTLDRVLNAQKLLFDNPAHRRIPWNTPKERSIVPPVAAGDDCRIDSHRVGRYVTLGDHVVLETNSTVEDSVLMDGVVVGAGAKVKHSILGPGVAVAPKATVEGQCLSATAK